MKDLNIFLQDFILTKENFNFNEYEILFHPGISSALFEPPIFMSKDSNKELEFVAMPLSCGMIFLVKKNFRFFPKQNEDNSWTFSFRKISESEKPYFLNFPIYFKDKNFDFWKISPYFYPYLMIFWFEFYGARVGKIISFNDKLVKNKEPLQLFVKYRNNFNVWLKSSLRLNNCSIKHIVWIGI